MASTASKWLIGCGVGCGLILLAFGAMVIGGGLWVRDTVKGFEEAVEARDELDRRYGAVEDFVPWPDGAVPAERMEAFLAAREKMTPAREQLAEAFSGLPMTEQEARELDKKPFLEKMGSIFKIVKSGVGLGAGMGDFFDARNRALLEQEMGFGEYTYLYVLSYHTWLGHSPTEGPEARLEESGEDVNIVISGDQLGGSFVLRVRRELRAMLGNQLGAVPEDATGEEALWREILAAEVDALENDRRRLPWEDGLPGRIAASLEPYRERLIATYDPTSNPFELARNRKQSSFSYQAD